MVCSGWSIPVLGSPVDWAKNITDDISQTAMGQGTGVGKYTKQKKLPNLLQGHLRVCGGGDRNSKSRKKGMTKLPLRGGIGLLWGRLL